MLNIKLPKTRYKWAAGVAPNYPNLEERADGAPIPIAYGDLHDVVPVCIDTVDHVYKIADHAIHSLDEVRTDTETLDPGDYTPDLAIAEFTLDKETPFLESGTTYYFVLDADCSVDAAKHLHLKRYDAAVCGYGDGSIWTFDSGANTWTADAAHDLRFWVWGRETLDGPETIQVNNSRHIWPNETQEFKDTAATAQLGQSFKTGGTAFYCTRIQVWYIKAPSGGVWTAGYIRVSIASDLGPPLVQIGSTSLDASAENYADPFLFPLRGDMSSNLLCDIEGATITGATAHRAVSGNIATIGTGAVHGLIVGSNVVISGMADATYDGTFTVKAVPDILHFTYTLVHADEGETADTGGTWVGAVVIGADMLEDLVVNRIGKSLSILDAAALLDFKTNRRQAIATYIDYDMTFGEIVGKLEASLLFKLVPLQDGTYAPTIYANSDPLGVTPPHFFDEHFLSFSMRHDFSAIKNIIKIKYDENPDNDEFKVSEADSDVARFVYGIEETLEVESYLKASAGAAWLAAAYLSMYETPPLEITFEVRGYGLDLNPGRNRVKITRTRAAYAGGAISGVLFRIIKITKKPATASTEIVAVLDTQTY